MRKARKFKLRELVSPINLLKITGFSIFFSRYDSFLTLNIGVELVDADCGDSTPPRSSLR